MKLHSLYSDLKVNYIHHQIMGGNQIYIGNKISLKEIFLTWLREADPFCHAISSNALLLHI